MESVTPILATSRPVKARSFALETLERRLMLDGNFTWANAAGGDWNVGANWVGGVAPGANSNVVIGALNAGAHVDFTGNATLASVTVSNHGTLVVQNGDLTVTNSTSIAAGGTFKIDSGSTVELSGTATNAGAISLVHGGILSIAAGATASISSGGSVSLTDSTIETRGTVTFAAGASFQMSDANFFARDNASLTIASADASATQIANSEVVGFDQASVTIQAATFSGSTLYAQGDSTAVINGNLILDSGSLSVSDGATMTVAASATVTASYAQFQNSLATFKLDGSIVGDSGTTYFQNGGLLQIGLNSPTGPPLTFGNSFVMYGGTLEGSGTITAGYINLGGVINPGGSGHIGTITFATPSEIDIAPETSLTFNLEVGPSGADRINLVTTDTTPGNLGYADFDTATVNVGYLPGFTPTAAFAGTTYQLFTLTNFDQGTDDNGFPAYGLFGHVETVFGTASSPGLDILTGPDSSMSVKAAIPDTGTTFTFVGPSGGSVDDPANWSGGKLPTFGSNIVIPVGIEAQIRSGVYEAFNNITVNGSLRPMDHHSAILLFGSNSTVNGLNYENDFVSGSETAGSYLVVEPGATLTLTGTAVFSQHHSFIVNGTLQLTPGSVLDDEGGEPAIDVNGTLSGTGEVMGTFHLSGNLAPGTGAQTGTITFHDDLYLEDNATVTIKVADAHKSDLVIVQGGISWSDNLTLSLKFLSTGIADYQFTFLTYTYNYGGEFANVTATSVPGTETITANVNYSEEIYAEVLASATSAAGESGLSSTLRAGLAGLQTILREFGPYLNLGTINYAAQGASLPGLAVLPSALESLFGLSTSISSATLPTISAASSNTALVTALLGAGFTVDAIAGGATVNGTVIPDVAAGSGLLIQAHYSATLLNNLTVAGSFGSNTFSGLTPNLLQGLAAGLSLSGNLNWTGSLALALAFGVDSQGFFIAPSSTLILSAAGSGSINGTGTIGGQASTSVSGTAGGNFTVNLELGANSGVYRVADLDGHLGDHLLPLISGSAAVSVTATAGPLSLTYAGVYTQTDNLSARTNALSLSPTLVATLQVPGLKNSSGAVATVALVGSFNSGTNTWTLAGSVTDLRLFGFTVSSGNFSVALNAASLAGSGSLSLKLDFLHAGATTSTVTLQVAFGATSGTLTSNQALGDLAVRDNQGGDLLTATSAQVAASLAFNFGADTLTGTLTLTANAGTVNAFTVSNATNPGGAGLTVTYDFATQAFSLAFDTLTLVVDEAFTLTVSGVSSTYSRTSSDPDQTLASIDNVTVQLTFLATPSSTGPPTTPTVTASNLTITASGFTITGEDLAPSATPHVGAFVRFDTPLVGFDSVGYDKATGFTGQVEAYSNGGALFPNQSVFGFRFGFGTAQFDLGTKVFDFFLTQFRVTAGSAFTVETQGGISFQYDPSITGHQQLGSFYGTATSSEINNMATVHVDEIDVSTDGVQFGTFTIGRAGGDTADFHTAGPVSITNPLIAVNNFGFTYGDTTTVTGSVTLTADSVGIFSGIGGVSGGLVDPTAQFDFAHGGHLVVSAASVQIGVGLVRITAGATTIDVDSDAGSSVMGATLSAPLFDGMPTINLPNFTITAGGFSLGVDSPIVLSQAGGVTSQYGHLNSPLSVSGVTVTIDDLVVDATHSQVTGSLSFTAADSSLFSGSAALSNTLGAISGTYYFAPPSHHSGGGSDGPGGLPGIPNLNSGDGSYLDLVVPNLTFGLQGLIQFSASNVHLDPLNNTLVDLTDATITSPHFGNLGTTTGEVLLDYNGVEFEGFTLGNGGTSTFGHAFSFTNVALSTGYFGLFTGLPNSVEQQGSIDFTFDSVSLYPDAGSAITSTLTNAYGGIDFQGDSPLYVIADSMTLTIAGTLALSADNVFFAPEATTIATLDTATVSSNAISGLTSVTLAGVELGRDGFTIDHASLGVAPGTVSALSDVFTITDAALVADHLTYDATASSPFSGTLGLTFSAAALFPDATSFLTTTLRNVSANFDLSGAHPTGSLDLTVGQFSLRVGDAFAVSASNVALTPNDATLATIAGASLSSPVITGLPTATLSSLVITRQGFSVADFTLAQAPNTTAMLGTALGLTGANLTVTGFSYDATNAANPVGGSITLAITSASLFSNQSLFSTTLSGLSASFGFGGAAPHGSLAVTVSAFTLRIGDALSISASNVTLAPSAPTIVTLATATVTSPVITNLASATISNLAIAQTGFTLGSFTLGQNPGAISRIGNALALSGASLVVTGFSYDTTHASNPVSGSIALTIGSASLYPDSTAFSTSIGNLVATYLLGGSDPTGRLSITVGTLSLTLGEALRITAADFTLTPGQPTIATLATATVASPTITGLATADLSNFVLTQTGFSIGDLTLTQNGSSARIGDVVGLTGATLTVTNFAYDSTNGAHPISGTVALSVTAASLYPASTTLTGALTGVTGAYDFSHSGQLALTVGGLDLEVGEAVRIVGSNFTLTPGQTTLATLASATISSPQFADFGSATLTGLVLTSTGFTIGNVTFGQSGGQTVRFSNVLELSGATFSLTDFVVTYAGGATSYSGAVGLSVTGVQLYPDSALFTTSVTDFTTTYDFSPGGDGKLHIHAGTFGLQIGQALVLSASDVEIRPGESTMFTLATATVTSPQYSGFGSATVHGVEFTQTGFTIADFSLGQSGGQTVDFGDVLELTGATFGANGFTVVYGGSSAQVSGDIGLSATGVSLFPHSTLFTTTVTNFTTDYDFSGGGAGVLRIHAGSFTLRVGDAILLTASNVDIEPDQTTMFTLADAVISSPQFPGLGSTTLHGLEIKQTGFSFGSFTLGQAGGQTVDFGDVLRLTGATFTATNFSVAYSASATTVSGTVGLTATGVALFPDSSLFTTTVSNFTTNYNFSPGGDGALHIHAGTFTLQIGQALQLVASNVEIDPGHETMFTLTNATVSSPQFADFGSGTATDVVFKQTGFSLGSFSLGQAGGQTVNFGDVLRLSGATFTADNFAVAYSSTSTTVSGSIGLAATNVALFPDSTLFTTHVSNFTTSYDFNPGGDGALHIHAGTFTLQVGQAVQVTAANIEIEPGQSTMFHVANATVSSPQFADFGSGTISDLEVTQTGFTLGSFTLGQAGGQTVNFNNVLRLTGATFTATDFAVAYSSSATSVSGTIGLAATGVSLFPNSSLFTTTVTGFTTSYNLGTGGDGALHIHAATVTLAIGEALQVSGANIDINPSSETMFTLATATVSSPQFPDFGSRTLTDLAVKQTGFTLGSFTLGQAGGQTVFFSNVLKLSGATFTATDFAVSYGSTTSVSGTIGLTATGVALFPNSTLFTTTVGGFTTSYDFSPAGNGKLKIHADTFTLQIGGALQVQAANVDINPGLETMFTLATATVSSPQFADFGTATITDLHVKQTGFTFGSFVLGQAGGQTVNFGSFLRLTGATFTATDFAVNYGSTTTVSGAIGLAATGVSLFPNSTLFTTSVQNFTTTYDFSPGGDGQLHIHAGVFTLAVGEALQVSATNVAIDPASETMFTLTNAVVSSPQFADLGTATLTSLEVKQTGFSFGSLQLGQTGGQTANFGSFLRLTGAVLNVSNFSVTYGSSTTVNGTIGLTAAGLTLFPGEAFLTTTVTGLAASYNFGPGGDGKLSIHVDTVALKIGDALQVAGSQVTITPGQEQILSIGSAVVTSPSLTGVGSTTISGFVVRQDGFSFDQFTVGQGTSQNVMFGNFLSLTGAVLSVNNFKLTVNGSGTSITGSIGLSATAVSLFPGATAFSTTIGGLNITYDLTSSVSDGALQIAAATFAMNFSTALQITATNIVITPGKPTILTIGTAHLLSPDITGISADIAGLVITQTGFSIASADLSPIPHSEVKFGDILTLTGLTFGVRGFSYNASTNSLQGTITIGAASAALFPGSTTFTATVTNLTGGYTIGAHGFDAISLSIGGFTLQLGTYLTFSGSGLVLTPAGPNVLTVGSVSASVTVAGITIGGTAQNFAITSSGGFQALTGFGVGLDLNTDSSAFKWPTWLPIHLTQLALSWPDIASNPLNFSIHLSADVTSIDNLSFITVAGSVSDLTIDLGELAKGNFPITNVGSASITVGGSMFGSTISGSLVLGIVQLDASNNQVAVGDTTTPVAKRVLYGGIRVTMSFAGMSGFSMELGISELGPLSVYVSADIPILLDPNSGLTISNFYAGVVFAQTLPSITDPLQLRSSAFLPANKLTDAQWVAQLESSVVNQAKTPGGASAWNVFNNPMLIEGGLSLYSAYISSTVFHADVNVIIDTSGKILLSGALVFGNSLSIKGSIYGDLSQISSGSATFLFLLDVPAESPVFTVYGGVTFNYVTANGRAASATNQATTFTIHFGGGVLFSAGGLVNASIVGTVDLAFTPSQFDLAVSGSISLPLLSNALTLVGSFHLATGLNGTTPAFWGALAITTNLDALQNLNLTVAATAVFEVNSTSDVKTESLTPPGSTKSQNYTLAAQTVAVFLSGKMSFSLGGADWFHVDGTWAMVLSPSSLSVYGTGNLYVGPTGAEFLIYSYRGFFLIDSSGIAATMEVTQLAGTGGGNIGSKGIALSVSWVVTLNTTGHDVTLVLPPTVAAINGQSSFTISGVPPGSTTGQGSPYLYLFASGDLTMLGTVTIHGSFAFTLSPTVLQMTADATLNLQAGGSTVFALTVQGGFRIDRTGVVAGFSLGFASNFTVPSIFGFTIDSTFTFQLLFNTTGRVQNIGKLRLDAGSYVKVVASGTLTIAGLNIFGSFTFTAGFLNGLPTLEIAAAATLTLKAGDTELITLSVNGGLTVTSAGIAAYLDLTNNTSVNSSSALNYGFTVKAKLFVNMTGGSLTVAGQSLDPGPYAKVTLSGTLTMPGLLVSGSFDLTVGTFAGAPSLEIHATGSVALMLGSTAAFTFGIDGGLHISSLGLAAYLNVTFSSGPSSLGFTSAFTSATLIVNTASLAQTVSGHQIAANYFGISASATLTVSGLAASGSINFVVSTYLGAPSIDVSGTILVTLKADTTTIYSFIGTAAMRITSAGLAGYAALVAFGNPPAGLGFTFTVSAALQFNTTGVSQSVGGQTLDAGPYGQVTLSGSLAVAGLTLVNGTFKLRVGTFGGKTTLDVTASATLNLQALSVNVLTLNVNGGLRITSDGIAGAISVSIASNIPSALGFTFSGSTSILLELNTTTSSYTFVTGTSPNLVFTTIPAGPYAKVVIAGHLVVAGLDLSGTFTLTASTYNGESIVAVTAQATLSLMAASVTVFSMDASGAMRISSKGLAMLLNVSLSGGVGTGYGFSSVVSAQLQINTTNVTQSFTIAGNIQTLEAGPYARVTFTADLTASNLLLHAAFTVTASTYGGLASLTVTAIGTVSFKAGTTTIFSLSVNSDLRLMWNGIAARISVSVGGSGNGSGYGFSGYANALLEINTTNVTQDFIVPINQFVRTTISIDPGPYARLSFQANLAILGTTLNGNFTVTASVYNGVAALSVQADAKFDLKAGSTTVLTINVNGFMRVTLDGLAAYLTVSTTAGNTSSSGYSFGVGATATLTINTTSSQQGLPAVLNGRPLTILINPGPYFKIAVSGDLVVGPFDINGSFTIVAAVVNGSPTLTVTAAGTMSLKAGSSTIFTFGVNGDLKLSGAGIAAYISLTVNTDLSTSFGFSVSVLDSFALVVNTTPDIQHFPGGINIGPGPYAEIEVYANVSIGGFAIHGNLTFTVSGSSVSVALSAGVNVFGVNAALNGTFTIYSTGVYLNISVGISTLSTSLLSLSGIFSLVINTTNGPVNGYAKNTAIVSVFNAHLTIAGLTLSGSISIGVSNGVFFISVPSSNPLTVSFFNITSISIYGTIQSDGYYYLSGSIALNFGNQSVAAAIGTATLTVSSSQGVKGTYNGQLYLFGQNVLGINGQFSTTPFTYSVTQYYTTPFGQTVPVATYNFDNTYFTSTGHVNFSLNGVGLNLTVNGTVTVAIGKNGISAYFSLGGSLFGLTTSATFLLNANTGRWWAQASIGLDIHGSVLGLDGGVSGSVTAFISSNPWEDAITATGSAYVGYDGYNISVDLSGSGSLSGVFSATATFKLFGATVASGSFSVDLVHNSIFGSDLGGGYAFLDPTGAGVWDSTMVRVPVDADGNFDFSVGDPHQWVVDSADGYAFRDANGNGVWDQDTEAYVPLDSNGHLPDVIARLLVPNTDFTTGAMDAASVLGSLRAYAVIDPATGLPTGNLDLSYGHLLAIGGHVQNVNGTTGAANTAAVDLGGRATGYTGLVGAGQTVFFDTNHNGQLDAGEISVTADAQGFYTFAPNLPGRSLGLLAIFDTNHNGTIDANEGAVFIAGAHDRNTGLPTSLILKVDGASLGGLTTVVSPLTTLRTTLIGLGATAADANARISYALGLSYTFDFASFSPNAPTTTDADRAVVLTATAQLETLLLNTASLLSAASHGTMSAAQVQAAAIDQLAQMLMSASFAPASTTTAPSHAALDLASVATVGTFITQVAGATHIAANGAAVDAAAQITTALNLAAAVYGAMGGDPTRNLARIGAVVEGQLGDSLAALATGTMSASNAIASYSGTNLMAQLNAVTLVPVVAPSVAAPGDVSVQAGSPVDPVVLGITSTTTPVRDLTVQVSSSNTALIADADIRVTFNGQNWLVSLVTTASQTGQTTITVSVADGDLVTTKTFNVTVVGLPVSTPVVATTPTTTATVGQPYTYTFAVNSSDAHRTFVIAAGTALPAWLTLTDNGDGTATLAGTPPDGLLGADGLAQFAISIVATDDNGASVTQRFTLVVSARASDGLSVTSGAIDPATAGSAYVIDLAADGDATAGPLVFSIANGLPQWLRLVDHGDGTATLMGTPSNADAGAVNLVVAVTDANGQLATLGVSFVVTAAQGIIPIGDLTMPINTTRSIGLQLFGVDTHTQISVSSNNPALLAASGLLLSGTGSTRSLTIAPTAGVSGDATILVSFLENGVVVATATFQLVVTAPLAPPPPPPSAPPPSITNPGTVTAPEDSTGTITIQLNNVDAAAILNVTSSNPLLVGAGGLTISGDGATRTLTFTLNHDVTGSSTITLTLTDAGVTTSVTFQLNVTPIDHPVRLLAPLPSFVVGVGSGQLVIDLSHYFSNVDGTTTFSLGQNSDSALLGARIEGNQLILTPAAARAGLATLDIVASSVGAGTGAITTAAGTVHVAVLPSAALSGPAFIRLANGAIVARFTLSLNAPSNQVIRLAFATVSGTARAGLDYTPTAGYIDIPSGASSATIDVSLAGTSLNPGLNFTLQLSSGLNALLDLVSSAQVNIPVDRTVLIPHAAGGATIGFGVVAFFAVPGAGVGGEYSTPFLGVKFSDSGFAPALSTYTVPNPAAETAIVYETSLTSLETPAQMRSFMQH